MSKHSIFIVVIVLAVAASGLAQTAYYSIFSFDSFIPKVTINDRSVTLQAGLYEDMYRERSARNDMRWVGRNDSLLVAFWEEQGDTVLHVLRELSGIEWQESEFNIYLVRYFPSIGTSDPLIIPIGGMGAEAAFEVAPDESRLILNLVYQLSRRMLSQVSKSGQHDQLGIAYHPLMRPGPYRFDNLSMLLALHTCENIIGLDTTHSIYESAFWKHHTPGRKVFSTYLLNHWILEPDHPLAEWIAIEPFSSELVLATRLPRKIKPGSDKQNKLFVEGLPLKGNLGFSTTIDESGCLVVDKIDIYRLGYACGLRKGDQIHRVEGYRVRTHRELVERILENLEYGGATVELVRENQTILQLIQPMELFDIEDTLYYYDPRHPDSLSADSSYFDSLDQ
ncbi:MAG: hypothetical protein U9R56_02330 [candidate division Zixibacteria bacterium]|nr:hypothetical protein [candidate division Zixibacteria bacterium]